MFPSGHFILLPEPSAAAAADDFFRSALLRLAISNSEAHEADLHVKGNPAEKQSPTRRHAPLFSGGLSFTRRLVWARDPFSGAKIPSPGSSSAVLLIYPSDGPPQAILLPLFGNFGFAAPPSVALLHGLGHFSSSQVPQP